MSAAVALFLTLSSPGAFAQSSTVYSYAKTAAPRGTLISTELRDTLNPGRLKPGSRVRLRLRDNIIDPVTKAVIVPKEATTSATVRHVATIDGAVRMCLVLEDAEWETGSKTLNAVVDDVQLPAGPPAPTPATPAPNVLYDMQWGQLLSAALPKGTQLNFRVPNFSVQGRFINQDKKDEYLELRPDRTAFLHQKQDYTGRYQVSGSVLSLDFGGWGLKATVEGNQLIDKSWGQKTVWAKQCLAVPDC